MFWSMFENALSVSNSVMPCPDSGFLISLPDFTLFDSGAVGRIAMLRVTGILCQHVAGDLGALTAVKEAFFLAAGGHGTFAVERMSFRLNTAAAAAGFLVRAFGAVQSAS